MLREAHTSSVTSSTDVCADDHGIRWRTRRGSVQLSADRTHTAQLGKCLSAEDRLSGWHSEGGIRLAWIISRLFSPCLWELHFARVIWSCHRLGLVERMVTWGLYTPGGSQVESFWSHCFLLDGIHLWICSGYQEQLKSHALVYVTWKKPITSAIPGTGLCLSLESLVTIAFAVYWFIFNFFGVLFVQLSNSNSFFACIENSDASAGWGDLF